MSKLEHLIINQVFFREISVAQTLEFGHNRKK